jgi:hypothetical protein
MRMQKRTDARFRSPRFLRISPAVLLLVAAATVHAATSLTRSADDSRISVTAVAGGVDVTMAGKKVVVSRDSTVLLPARIVTGRDGTVGITQAGTNLSVANDTDVEIPAEAVDGNLIARLVQHRGNVFYDVAPRDVGKLRVETPLLVAVIKGTQFNVAVQEDSTTISLFEGRLEIRTPDNTDVVQLNAGEIAIRSRVDDTIRVVGMDDERVAAPRQARAGAADAAAARPETADAVVTERVAVANDGVTIGAGVRESGSSGDATVALKPSIAGTDLSIGTLGGGAIVDVGGVVNLARGAVIALDTGVDLGAGSVDVGLNARVDLGGGSVDLGLDTGVDLGAGSVDVGLDAGVDLGGASVDLGLDTGVDLGAGSVDVGLDAGVDLGGASVDLGLDAGADLGAGTVDLGLDTGVDLGAATVDLGLDTGVDLGAGTVDLGLGAGTDLGAAVVDVGADAGLDLGGALDLGVDAGLDLGGGVDATVDAGVTLDPGLDLGVDADVDLGIVDVGLDLDLGGGTLDLDLGLGGGSCSPTGPAPPPPPSGGGLGGLLGGLR